LSWALAMLVACSAREPAGAGPTPEAKPKTQDAAPLVTVELGLLGDEARKRLAERHPGSELARAETVLAVHHRIAEPWHIYWQNPGESGLRTRIELSGKGFEPGAVVYPAPERFVAEGGQVTYGWEHDAVLFVPLSELADVVELELRSDWLACHESCIPGHGTVDATIAAMPIHDDPTTLAMVDRIPEPAGDRLQTRWTGSKLIVQATLPDTQLTQFFPYAYDHAVLESHELGDAGLELGYRFDAPPPAGLGQGVLAITSAGETRWLELAAPWPTS
jgi:DsbC/DsbD-like thiol-disulfide interchange protein